MYFMYFSLSLPPTHPPEIGGLKHFIILHKRFVDMFIFGSLDIEYPYCWMAYALYTRYNFDLMLMKMSLLIC